MARGRFGVGRAWICRASVVGFTRAGRAGRVGHGFWAVVGFVVGRFLVFDFGARKIKCRCPY